MKSSPDFPQRLLKDLSKWDSPSGSVRGPGSFTVPLCHTTHQKGIGLRTLSLEEGSHRWAEDRIVDPAGHQALGF